MLFIEPATKDAMIKDALNSFPDECCGFLFGAEKENERTISEIVLVNNAKEGDKRRRFAISPLDYLKAERFAEERGLSLLGVYHSHPDHPSVPSEHDRLAAQPYFSYVIISVNHNRFNDIRSWRLTNESQFEEEKVSDLFLINQIN